MKISVTDSQGKVMEVGTYETEAAGGEVYGQLLVKDVKIPVPTAGGLCRIEAKLCKEILLLQLGMMIYCL